MFIVSKNFRKKLLAESRFSRYLVYAIGEIVLVIIGLLIALQINNFNTERKENQALKSYLENIKKNVVFDIKNINEIISKREAVSMNSRRYLTLLKNKNFRANDLFSVFRSKDYDVFVEFYFQTDQSGFEALKSSGYLNKITGTELETKLYEYNYHIKKIGEQEKSLNEFIENLEIIGYSQNIFQRREEELSRVSADTAYLENNREKIRKSLNHPIFTATAVRSTSGKELIRLYKELILIGENIVELIDGFRKGTPTYKAFVINNS